MPRYYFDIDDGETSVQDEEGLDLPGFDHARVHAQSVLGDLARDVVPEDGTQRRIVVFVRDDAGNTVLRASLSLVVEAHPSDAAAS
jgi:hypothetical protein